jgi:tetratricopeptide (TPR) repeat protein
MTASPETGAPPRARSWLPAALIAAAGAWAFSSSLGGGWLWDDDHYVTGNLLLRSPAGLARIWVAPPGLNYFPVTATVTWLQWQLWGDHPLGYRLTNLALHLAGAFLVWRLAGRLGVRRGWLAGLLFAVHPLAVESVAWISELKNVLALPLALLALLAYLDFDERGGRGVPWRAAGLFLAAMLAKSTVALLPVVLLLAALWRRGRLRRSDALATAPFFAISLVLGLVTIWFEHTRAMGPNGPAVDPGLARLAAAGLGSVFYLAKFVWPFGLVPIYPRWVVAPISSALLWPWAAWIAVFWASRGSVWGRPVRFALGAYLAMLAPVLGWVPMAYSRLSWVADHFAYPALPALAILTAAGIEALARRLPAADRPGRRGILAAAVAAALLLAAESRSYSGVFVSPAALWSYTVRQNPGAWSAHNDLGEALFAQGRVSAAIEEYRQALRINPDYVYAHLNLGDALQSLGRLPEAIAEYQEAVRLQPGGAGFHHYLGDALSQAGRLPEAIAQFEEALRLKPDYPQAENALGSALFRSGDVAGALDHFAAALRIDPGYAEACVNRGTVLASVNRLPEAIGQFQRAVALTPDSAGAHLSLGNAYYQANRLAEAVAEYEAALRLGPAPAETHDHFGILLAGVGRLAEAEAQFREALRLAPLDADAREHLARLQSIERSARGP